ncbi:MAG TPA: DUF1566 domain-containing protein [Steroidobacteraceae bacterium]|nr:DUF1566 domain-containing protein [Steroidobacteraceae bacterium]
MNNIIPSRRITVASRAATWLQLFGAALLLLCCEIRPAQAVAITFGNRIDITASTFALPVQIVDAVGVSEWFLDLTYDPTDVQVNVGCDPFSGDIYCSLLTGPVTEGDFFAAGAPFNLLIPGFVELDPVTLAQTGRLFGMHGAFGGFPPAPSGNGILAYIEFTILGTGDGPIDPVGEVVSEPEPVPEPGTPALLAIALAWLGVVAVRRRVAVGAGVLVAALFAGGNAMAQEFPQAIELPQGLPVLMPAPIGGYPPTVAPTAASPNTAPPAWSQTLAPNLRFVILSNFNHDAVLDRETGLVWARRTVQSISLGYTASHTCRQVVIGNRMGWRLPTIAELQSLIDPSVAVAQFTPRLPPGHPFVLSTAESQLPYWSAESYVPPDQNANAARRILVELVDGGIAFRPNLTDARAAVLCVRGHDASRVMLTF